MSVISLSSDDDNIEEYTIIETDDEDRGHIEDTVQVFVDENCIEDNEIDIKKERELAQNPHSDHLDYEGDPLANSSRSIHLIDLEEDCNENYDGSQNILQDPLLIKENLCNVISSNISPQDELNSNVVQETDNRNCKTLAKTSVKRCIFKKSEVLDVQLYKISVDEDLQVGSETTKPIASQTLQNHSSNPLIPDNFDCEENPFVDSIPLKDDYNNKSDDVNNTFKLTENSSFGTVRSLEKDKLQYIAEYLARVFENSENKKKKIYQADKQLLNCDNVTVNSTDSNKEMRSPSMKTAEIFKNNSNDMVSICRDSIHDKELKGTQLNAKNVNQEYFFEMSKLKTNNYNSPTSNLGPKKRGRKPGWRKNPGKSKSHSDNLLLSTIERVVNQKQDDETLCINNSVNLDGIKRGRNGRRRKNPDKYETSSDVPMLSKVGNIINEKQVIGTLCSTENVNQDEKNGMKTMQVRKLNIEKYEIGALNNTMPISERRRHGRKRCRRKVLAVSKSTISSKLSNNDAFTNKVNTGYNSMINEENVNKCRIGPVYTNSPLERQLVDMNSEQKKVVKKTFEHENVPLKENDDKFNNKLKFSVNKVNGNTYVSNVSPTLELPNDIHKNKMSALLCISDSNMKSLSSDSNNSHIELDMESNTNSVDAKLTKDIEKKSIDCSRTNVGLSEDYTSDFDPNQISIEHITNMSTPDLEILKFEFIVNYTKLFDEEAENKCVEMGDFLLLAMKEARNYKLRVKSSDKFTCDKLRSKEISKAKQNYENLIKLYRRPFEVLFVAFYRRISSTLITASQRKNMIVALFLKIFLSASSLSSEFSDCLLDAKLNFVALISKKVFNFPLVFIVFSCNEMTFERDCCLILEFMKDCSTVNDNLSQENGNVNKNHDSNIASENNYVNELPIQTAAIKKENDDNELAVENLNPCLVEEKEKSSHIENNFVTLNKCFKNNIDINLQSIGSIIEHIVEKTVKLPIGLIHKKTDVIEKEVEIQHLKYKLLLDCPQKKPLNSENDETSTFQSHIQNRDIAIDKYRMLYMDTNQSGLLSQSPMRECLEKDKLKYLNTLGEQTIVNISTSDPLTSNNNASGKRKPIEATKLEYETTLNKKNKVFKSNMPNSTMYNSLSDAKSQHISYNKTPLSLNSVNWVSNQHAPNNEV